MASYNTVITNEGAALLASVIANQGTLTLSEMRFSTTDYDGVEQTLTVGTFGGVFITAAASGSVVDATTIKVGAQFDNSGIVGDHPLYSIGIVGTDGNTTALIAVCTTTNPDIIRAALTGVSTYAFNVNLAVSSTSNITVAGTTAAVLYDTDVVDNLISTATDKPLSANQGRVLKGNIDDNFSGQSNENLLDNPWFTVNQRGFTSHTMGTYYFPTADRWLGISSDYGGVVTLGASGMNFNKEGYSSHFYLTQKMEGLAVGKVYTLSVLFSDGTIEHGTGIINSTSDYVEFEFSGLRGKARIYYLASWSQWLTDIVAYAGANFTVRAVKLELGTVSTLANDVAPDYAFELAKCRASTADPSDTCANQGNLVNYADLTTIHATGSTNTTGAQIDAGTFFYLNGQFCKALQNIAANAAYTENTNYKKDTVGANVTALNGLINGSVKQYPNTNTLLTDVGLSIESRTTQQFVNAIPKGIYMCPIVNTASDPTDIPSSYGVFVIFKSGTTTDQIGAIFIGVNSKLHSFSSYSGSWTTWT